MSDEEAPSPQQVAEVLVLEGLLDQAAEARQRRRAADPEWTTARCTPVHELVAALAAAIIRADAWHRNYRPPPGLGEFLDFAARRAWRRWGVLDEVVEISLDEAHAFFSECLADSPIAAMWGAVDPAAPVLAVWVGQPVSAERQPMSLEAVANQAATYLRNERRHNDLFEARFAAGRPAGPCPCAGERRRSPADLPVRLGDRLAFVRAVVDRCDRCGAMSLIQQPEEDANDCRA